MVCLTFVLEQRSYDVLAYFELDSNGIYPMPFKGACERLYYFQNGAEINVKNAVNFEIMPCIMMNSSDWIYLDKIEDIYLNRFLHHPLI